jgi:hypothetical protein
MATAELNTYLSQAEQALASGDRPAAAILINQVLLHDFVNDGAWRSLQRLLGNDQALEVFQSEFAKKYYPDQAHLLTPTSGQDDEPPQAPVSETPAVSLIPEPTSEAPESQTVPESDEAPDIQVIPQPDETPSAEAFPPANLQPAVENPPLGLRRNPGALHSPVSAEKIAGLVEELGWLEEAAAQHCLEYLIEIGLPAVDTLIGALLAVSKLTSKRKEKELRCQRAARALIGIGRPAMPRLLEAALDKTRIASAAKANRALVRIGVEGLDILLERIKIEPPGSANWAVLDEILSEILEAPSQKQIKEMYSREAWARIALGGGALAGGLLGLSSGDPLWVLAGIVIGGYLVWSFAWTQWQGWGGWGVFVALALNVFTAPFVARDGMSNRKAAEKLRADRVEKFTQTQSPGPQAVGARNIPRRLSGHAAR